ncbi:hypothetical protein FHT86_003065 [Rhizobium sp. BK313]|jgi:hypothetical protein|nr:hypothetical protein [Rhizobium sp. BK313]
MTAVPHVKLQQGLLHAVTLRFAFLRIQDNICVMRTYLVGNGGCLAVSLGFADR